MEQNIMKKQSVKECSSQVDVIIPTYHPDEKLQKLLNMLKKQTMPVHHIYIINTEESYFPETLVQGEENITVTHIKKEQFDHGGTRNQAAAMSEAPFLLFLTQDAVPYDEHLVASLYEAFSDEQVAAAYARQLAKKEEPLEYYTRTFNYPENSRKKTKADLDTLGIKTFFCSNVCAMYRKEVYEEMGGFVLHAIFNEDMMMAAKMIEKGYAIYYAADAKVWHSHNYSAWTQLRRNFDVAVSQQMAGGLFTQVKSEKEGIKLVKNTCLYMIKIGKWYLIPKVIWQSGFKFIGYKLGQNYKKLNMKWIKKISFNPSFWDRYEKAKR